MRGVLFLLLSFLFLSCSPPSSVDPVTGKVSGERIYQNYCVSCHGLQGQINVGNRISLQGSKANDSIMRQRIMYGSENGMPKYQSLLSNKEMNAVIEHIKTAIRK